MSARAREQADQVADRARDNLLVTLEELARRRRRASDWSLQLRLHRTALLVAAGGVVLGVGVAIARHEAGGRQRARRLATARRARARRNAERLGASAAGAPAWRTLARKVLVSFGVAFATRVARRAAAAVLPEGTERQKGELHLH